MRLVDSEIATHRSSRVDGGEREDGQTPEEPVSSNDMRGVSRGRAVAADEGVSCKTVSMAGEYVRQWINIP